MGNSKKVGVFIVIAAVLVFAVVYFGISATKDIGKTSKQITTENAGESLSRVYKNITVNTVTPRKGQVDLNPENVKDSLPDIEKYPAQVNNNTPDFVEIFSSTEKAGTGKDGWLVDVANEFNNSGITVNGKKASVKIRGLASGQAADYITSGKYVPDAFTPSNELWGEMIKAKGVKVELIDPRMTGNVAGILISKNKQDELIKKYGAVNIKTITDAVSKNELAMGYTNPFASSTGLNFLITALSTFDNSNPLSTTAEQGFETFQTNIPFVAYTTLQMRDSAKSGVLDGFILEYQQYSNTPDIKTNYVFTPFGVRHDSPLYAVGDQSDDSLAILKKFDEFCKTKNAQQLATSDGFNGLDNYKSEMKAVSGDVIASAQKLWKEKKDSGKPICAVFVADTSGSMDGDAINNLKKSLNSGAKYIGNNNYVGLVSYANDVSIDLPLAKFDITQRSYFAGAVEDMQAGGGTATFDGIIVGIKMLEDQIAKDPNIKPMLFVLSDGETNSGHSLNEIRGIVEAYKIPIYTIGYNADIKALESISTINEAASINADTDDVVYKLESLFNAQM